jgi:uncharacterized membrane protein YbhN (UPF0104 family)
MIDSPAQRQRVAKRTASARATLARRDVRIVARVLAVAIVVLVALNSKSLFSQIGNIGHPDGAWVGLAVAAEIFTLLVYSLMVREFLRLGRVTARSYSFVRPSLVGTAMTASLPGGVGASNLYWFNALRRQGADGRLAALVMAGTSIAGAISLAGLLAIGIALAGNAGPLAPVHAWLLCIAAMVLVLRLVFSQRLGRLLTRVLRRIDTKLEPSQTVRAHRLRMIMLFAYTNWLIDCVALYASLQAAHAPVPARGVVLVYVLAQLVNQLAVLPGGGGTVELSLAGGFAAFGARHGSVFAGVLLYRFLSCWGLIPLGWLGFALEQAHANRIAQASTGSPRHRLRLRLPDLSPSAPGQLARGDA